MVKIALSGIIMVALSSVAIVTGAARDEITTAGITGIAEMVVIAITATAKAVATADAIIVTTNLAVIKRGFSE